MLAIANKHGEVQASIPGLARVAGVSVEDCEASINKFLSPDAYSRTPDDEGRRIEHIEGGWQLLNHAKYRAMASKDEAITANAERQRRFRAQKGRNKTVTDSNGLVTHSNTTVTDNRDIAEAEADTEAKAENTTSTSTSTTTQDPKPNGNQMKESVEAVEVVLDAYDEIPTGNKPDMITRERRVQSIKSDWKLPFTYAEQQILMQNAKCLDGISDEEWETIKKWMRAKLPKGTATSQPYSRVKFLEWLPDVYRNAMQWGRKNPSNAPESTLNGFK